MLYHFLIFSIIPLNASVRANIKINSKLGIKAVKKHIITKLTIVTLTKMALFICHITKHMPNLITA